MNKDYAHSMQDDLISRQDALKPFCIAPDGTRIPEVDCDNFPVEFSVEFIKKHLLSLPSAEAEDRLYIKIYADDEPSVMAEKLYQICGETQNGEVAKWLKEYFPSAEPKTGKWIPVTRVYTTTENDFPYTRCEYVDATEPDEIDAVRCSECGEVFDFYDARNWCTQCGADMRGDKHE